MTQLAFNFFFRRLQWLRPAAKLFQFKHFELASSLPVTCRIFRGGLFLRSFLRYGTLRLALIFNVISAGLLFVISLGNSEIHGVFLQASELSGVPMVSDGYGQPSEDEN
ncbi:unnamed protein product [Somion occarium]|uniref:Uncharacterized protein n=1 Tax=Somion occarium TaxID=3059160 RepID=A0ABP1DX07_9APHY